MCVWECTLEPDDLVEWEPPSKKEKPKDSDSEDDIDIDKVIEKTEKQKAYAEKKLLDSGEKISLFFLYNFFIKFHSMKFLNLILFVNNYKTD